MFMKRIGEVRVVRGGKGQSLSADVGLNRGTVYPFGEDASCTVYLIDSLSPQSMFDMALSNSSCHRGNGLVL